ncbi:hypothetical protein ACFCW6_05485 [Streptomyces sp. NPDC056333]|uniref:hypothetical protein n=1 Tax=Streptomyces sp. NPDC056333 TaxID=3345786 RepID=UPI0035D5FEEB
MASDIMSGPALGECHPIRSAQTSGAVTVGTIHHGMPIHTAGSPTPKQVAMLAMSSCLPFGFQVNGL